VRVQQRANSIVTHLIKVSIVKSHGMEWFGCEWADHLIELDGSLRDERGWADGYRKDYVSCSMPPEKPGCNASSFSGGVPIIHQDHISPSEWRNGPTIPEQRCSRLCLPVSCFGELLNASW